VRIAVVLVAAVLCAGALFAFVVQPFRCNRAVAQLAARTSLALGTASDYNAVLQARENLAALRRLEGPCRTDVQLYALEGNNEEILGRKDDAVQSYRRALSVDQRPELHFALGTLLVELGRMDEAVDHYVTSIRFSPERQGRIASPEAARRVAERLGQ
jgi:tetratricopeptide (TPR) repeat protein